MSTRMDRIFTTNEILPNLKILGLIIAEFRVFKGK
jgi:hypothetical protein